MNTTPLFKFYEVVKVFSENQLLEVNGLTGAILGMVKNDNDEWSYGVHIFEKGMVWDLKESDLIATGKHMKKEDFYGGDSVQVRVDPETGEGNTSND